MSILLEAVCCSARDCEEAEAGGADRIELCAAIELGGLTPSLGLLQEAVARTRLPIQCMIRPRAGAFCYDEAAFATMRRDVGLARDHGAAGVVFGILTPEGDVDRARMAILVEAAGPLESVCHRAFDVAADPGAALEILHGCGIRRILTSGRAPAALAGAALIRALVGQAAGRLEILAGGGIRAGNVVEVVRATGVSQVHGGPFAPHPDGSGDSNPAIAFGPAGGGYTVADRAQIRAIRARLDAFAAGAA